MKVNKELELETFVVPLIKFKVTSHDVDNRVVNITVTTRSNVGIVKRKMYKSIRCSALLQWCLINNDTSIKLGVEYESTPSSVEFKSNPLQFIEYWVNNDEDNTRKVGQLLACVHERAPLIKNGKKTYRYHNKSNYRRYRNFAKA